MDLSPQSSCIGCNFHRTFTYPSLPRAWSCHKVKYVLGRLPGVLCWWEISPKRRWPNSKRLIVCNYCAFILTWLLLHHRIDRSTTIKTPGGTPSTVQRLMTTVWQPRRSLLDRAIYLSQRDWIGRIPKRAAPQHSSVQFSLVINSTDTGGEETHSDFLPATLWW